MTYETRKHSKTFSASNAYAPLGLLLTCLPRPLHLLPPYHRKKTIEHVYHALINRKRKEFHPTMVVVSKNWQNQSSLHYFCFPKKIPSFLFSSG